MSNWIEQESEKLELEQKKFEEEGGNLPFWKAPEGESEIRVNIDVPVKDSNFPDKKQFHIFIGEEEKIWSVSRKSPLYRDVIRALKLGKTKFKLIRVGMDAKDTRYSLVVVENKKEEAQ